MVQHAGCIVACLLAETGEAEHENRKGYGGHFAWSGD